MQLTNFSVTITRKKIKNLYLRVHSDGTITVSAPKRLSDKAIRDFVNSKSDWILTQLEKIEQQKRAEQENGTKQFAPSAYVTGESHYYWGNLCKLVVEETKGKSRVEFIANPYPGEARASGELQNNKEISGNGILHMYVPVNSTVEQRRKLLEEFYRQQLKQVVPELLEQYCKVVGKEPKEWRIRNMKTRWGTCNTKDDRIWLSLHLAKKHPDCLSYVIVHELTHLYVPNHGKAFWARMDVYYPRWREVRRLLNK